MRPWLNYIWDALRERLWFIPSLFSLLGVVAAILLLSVDQRLDGQSEWLPSALRTTGSAARTVLGALIGRLVTVDRQAIQGQAEMILRNAEKHIDEPNDLCMVQQRYERVVKRL